jgi:hypothetical protein
MFSDTTSASGTDFGSAGILPAFLGGNELAKIPRANQQILSFRPEQADAFSLRSLLHTRRLA